MTDMDLVTVIGQVGFPIAVATFLLYKGYTQDKEYLQTLTQIKEAVEELRASIEGKHG